jgi:glycosyltransferase involved in cell wall biosynthesis
MVEFPAPVIYSDPWLLPLRDRLTMLCRRKRRVAYFYEQPNNSTFRYRAYNMAQVLNEFAAAADVSASYFFLEDVGRFDEIADAADLLVVCRSRYGALLSQLMAKFRARRKRILFDVDDLVFDPAYTRLLVQTLGLNAYDDHVWEQWFAMTARLGAVLKECDGAIGTNEMLAKRLEEFSGLPARVVPNFLNREQMDLSDRVYEARSASGFAAGEKVRLGYFSGSPSHRLDYAIIEDALANIMEQNSRVELVVVGYIEPTDRLRALQHRIVKVPFQDYVNLQRVIGDVDLNLMPLQVNAFTDCKSELKFFDAAAVGTISVASPTHTYSSAIVHGSTGYLAQSHAWTSVIRCAISANERRKSIAEAARKVVLDRFVWSRQTDTILSALQLVS